jgi:integrase
LRPLRRFYGETAAKKFGPLALAALQEKMIRLGWARTFINRQINRVRMCFKWGVSKELIPSSVYESLRTVQALAEGRSDARETEPVKPVDKQHAWAIFSFLSPQVQAMVELQALTGMRPGEACMMRGCDVTTPKDKTWT